MNALDVRQIMDILPHRFPFLLIDRITELVPMKRAVGFKNITANEHVFVGHFPGNPVLPGVFMVEALAQLGGASVLNPGDFHSKIAYLAGIDKVRFRRPVVPGDCLMMETTVTKTRKNIGWVSAVATVDEVTVCTADLMFSVVDDTRPGVFRMDASILHE